MLDGFGEGEPVVPLCLEERRSGRWEAWVGERTDRDRDQFG